MSYLASTWAWQQTLPPNWKLVLMALADHAHDDGTNAFPSVALIARKTGYSERQVKRILAELVGGGVTRIVSPATLTRPTEYGLNLSDTFEVTRDQTKRGLNDDPEDNLSPPPGVTNETGEVDKCDQNPVANVTLTVREPSVEPSSSSTEVDAGLMLFDDPTTPVAPCLIEAEFAEWYSLYPRHVGKKPALSAYRKARKRRSHQDLMDGLRRHLPFLTAEHKRGFCKHPATWLNGEHWDDEIQQPRADRSDGVTYLMNSIRSDLEAIPAPLAALYPGATA